MILKPLSQSNGQTNIATSSGALKPLSSSPVFQQTKAPTRPIQTQKPLIPETPLMKLAKAPVIGGVLEVLRTATPKKVAEFVVGPVNDVVKQAGTLLGYKMSGKTQTSIDEAFKMSRQLIEKAKKEKDQKQKEKLLNLSRKIDSEVSKTSQDFTTTVQEQAGKPLTPAKSFIKTAVGVGTILAPFGKGWTQVAGIGAGTGAGLSVSEAESVDDFIKKAPIDIAIGAATALGLKGAGTVFSKIVKRLNVGSNTPEEVVSAVIGSKQEKTKEGQKLVKIAMDAKSKGEDVVVNVKPPKRTVKPTPKPKVANAGLYDTLDFTTKNVPYQGLGTTFDISRAGQSVGKVRMDLKPYKGKLELHDVLVDEQQRQKGLGTQIIKQIFDKPGVTHLTFNVPKNTPPFWEKIGAEFISQERMMLDKKNFNKYLQKAGGVTSGTQPNARILPNVSSVTSVKEPKANTLSSIGTTNDSISQSLVAGNKGAVAPTSQLQGKSPLPQPTIGGVKPKLSPESVKSVEKPKMEAKGQSRVFERLQKENPDQLTGELPYDKAVLKTEFDKAANRIAKDKQDAFDVAMGTKGASDIESVATNIEMAEKALEEGNHKLYEKLIRSRSIAQTKRGQAIVAERASVTDNSTARYVKDLLSTRLDNLGKRYLSGLEKGESIKKNATRIIEKKAEQLEIRIKKGKLDTKTALSLLDELTCV